MLQSHVFKAYDIRGVYGVEWDAAGAAQIARAFIQHFGIKKLVLGWDMRVSSPVIVAEIERAAVAAGAHVIKVGEVTTPVLYFATAGFEGNDGGIMVTASHNTGEWNGMKLLLGSGAPVGETSGLAEIKALAMGTMAVVAHDESDGADAAPTGSVEQRDVIEACYAKIFSLIPLNADKQISIVIDCGNGMAGATIHKLLARLPFVTAHIMFDNPDGAFPNHEANPLKEETLDDLKREVVARGAQLGIAFDGDGDRVGFVDEEGRMIGGDVMTGLIGVELLKTHPGATILYDLRSRHAVARAIEAAGGHPEMSRVGHAFIKKQMRELGGLFAGELSCHFYFQEYFGVECADLAVLYALKLLQESDMPFSQIAHSFLSDAHSGEINFEVADRAAALAKLESTYASSALRVSKMDGLLIEMEDWWFNVRPSNTEPLLRLNAEAHDPFVLEQKLAEIKTLISE